MKKYCKKEKINIALRILFTTMLILTCIMIFDFSKQNGGTSGSLSRDIMKFIAGIFTKDEQKIVKIISKGEPILRKIAHFTVYTSLGVWAMCMMQTYFRKSKKMYNNNTNNIKNVNSSENTKNVKKISSSENTKNIKKINSSENANNIKNVNSNENDNIMDVNSVKDYDDIDNMNDYDMEDYDRIMKKRMLISIIIGFLYAISDEIHQSFIPNRSARAIDVFLDTLGATNGVLIIAIIVFIYKHYKNITKELK